MPMDKIKIGNKLLDHGFSAADKGFGYLIDAVDHYRIGMPIGNVYAYVAGINGSKPTRIERCIRSTKEKNQAFKHLDNRELVARLSWNIAEQETSHV